MSVFQYINNGEMLSPVDRDCENTILSFLSNKDIIYSLHSVNKHSNKLCKIIKNKSSDIIKRFIAKLIYEKKAIRYILNPNNTNVSNISKKIIYKYIIKCYPNKFKQKALIYFVSNIRRDERISINISEDSEKMLIFTTFMLDVDTQCRLNNVFNILESENNNCIHMLYNYFVRYLILTR